jgi:hypothetical protein
MTFLLDIVVAESGRYTALMNSTATANRDRFAAACDAVLGMNDFWVLSELTDYSYEVGTKAHDFKQVVRLWKAHCGLPAELEAQLQEGINGNVARVLGCCQNKGAGQDLCFGEPPNSALAEIKLVHTATLSKYYRSIAADWAKLAALRPAFNGDLFLAVFFAHLPNYDYPACNLGGQLVSKRVFQNSGIMDQFERARREIGRPPAWPVDSAPLMRLLNIPAAPILEVIELWCERFSYVTPWRFDAARHLQGASVACAIWEID